MRKSNGPKRRARCAERRGFATVAALMMGVVLVGVVLVSVDVATTQIRLSEHGQQKATALFVADAGIDDALVHLKMNHSWSGEGTGQSLGASDASGAQTSMGSFTSTAALATDGFSATIHSSGANSGPGSSKVVGIVTFTPVYFADAAIRAKGNVNLNGNVTIKTTSGNSDADVWTGGNITMRSAAATDYGKLVAVGTIDSPPAGSQGIVSVNPNYGVQPAFPDPTTLQSQMETAAGGSSSSESAGSAFSSSKGKISAVVTAPAYINGDLTMTNGDSVTLKGTGTIYINGSITMHGGTLINDVVGTVGVAGTFSTNGNATYEVGSDSGTNGDGSTVVPTLAAFNNGDTATDAITLNGTSSTSQEGILYAVNGNIKLTGNNTFEGALVAGNGEVDATGNFTQIYPDDLRSSIPYPGDPRLTFWGEEQ